MASCMLTQIRLELRGRKPNRGASNGQSPDISPTDRRRASGFSSHRKALAVLGADYPASRMGSSSSSRLSAPEFRPESNQQASINERPSPAEYKSVDTSSTSLNHRSEPGGAPASPSLRPGQGPVFSNESIRADYDANQRRPSIASATTVSSQGSRSSASGKFRKRLQGFFGDEYHISGDSRPDSDCGDNQNFSRKSSDRFRFRDRADSEGSQNKPERRSDQSRPNTPLPSSEITPWLYQSFNVSVHG